MKDGCISDCSQEIINESQSQGMDGITLYAPEKQLSMLAGLTLNYYGDLSGGGFLISCPEMCESCVCGSGFRTVKKT